MMYFVAQLLIHSIVALNYVKSDTAGMILYIVLFNSTNIELLKYPQMENATIIHKSSNFHCYLNNSNFKMSSA